MKAKHLVFLFLGVFLAYLISSNGETPYNYFSLLADAFSKGRFYVTTSTIALSELIPIGAGKYLVPYAPMPAIILTPFAFFWHLNTPQTLASILMGATLSVITFKIAYKITNSRDKAFYLAILISFGTNVWYTASVGSSWYFAQIVAAVFLSAAILSSLSNKSYFLTGFLLSLAYLARPHVLLSLPFFVFYKKFKFKNLLKLGIGILPALIFNVFYNFNRFGVVWDKGYTLIPGVLNEPWFEKGIFNVQYIPRHLKVIFTSLPHITNHFPYLLPDQIGMALWITTPAFLIFVKSDVHSRLTKISLLSAFLVAIPILMHGSTGFTQFGYRFAIDIYPFLFVILAGILRIKQLNKRLYLLLVISVIINLWGVLFINKLGFFV